MLDGESAEVVCAIRADGRQPAAQLLDDLAAGTWADPDVDELPDSRQASDLKRLLDLVQRIADGESYLGRGMMNYLWLGIWELKVGRLRVTFYDTDGHGNSCTTYPLFVESGWDQKNRYARPDEFGESTRLGHHFVKSGPHTSRHDMAEAEATRREDFDHDR